jgi:hypothetical protein
MNDVQRHEELAEASYDAMYRALPPHRAKAHYEDAAANFSKAIAAARKAGAQEAAAPDCPAGPYAPCLQQPVSWAVTDVLATSMPHDRPCAGQAWP